MSAAVENAGPGSSGAASTNANSGDERIETMAALPWSQRLKFAAMTFAFQKLLIWPMETFGSIQRDYLGLGPGATTRPDIIKTYPVRRGLPVRIFVPSSTAASNPDTPTKLPILFTIHGGGFVIGSPPDNDAWNRSFANRHNTLVIALNYSKAPGSPFPGPINDLEALFTAILTSPSPLPSDLNLELDTSRIAILGFSAGGNLSLALTQRLTSSLRSSTGTSSSPLRDAGITETSIKAVVPIYPVLDFTTPLPAKVNTRQYKPSIGGFRANPRDYLLDMAPMFDWSYIPSGQSLYDPLLSPAYLDGREGLPQGAGVFVIGAEMDILCHEAWRLASRLAGREVPGLDEKVGREDVLPRGELVLEGDEKFAWEVESSGGDGGRSRVRWLLVPDAVHGFDQDIKLLVGGDKEILEDAKEKTERIIGVIGEWLFDGPFKV